MPTGLWQLPPEKRAIALGILNDLYASYVQEGSIKIHELTGAKIISPSRFIQFSKDARKKFVENGRINISFSKEKADISSVDLIHMINSYVQKSRGIRTSEGNGMETVPKETPQPTESPKSVERTRKDHKPLRATDKQRAKFSTKMRAANDDTEKEDQNYPLFPLDN